MLDSGFDENLSLSKVFLLFRKLQARLRCRHEFLDPLFLLPVSEEHTFVAELLLTINVGPMLPY